MQTRRSFVITASSLSCLSLAGCLGSDESEDAEQSYEDALSLLDENAASLDEFGDYDEIPEQFDDEEIKQRADSADEKLDEAESGISDDDQELVENARAVAAYQRTAADYSALVVDFGRCFDTVDAYVNADRFEAANDELDECQDLLAEIQDQYEAVDDRHSEIDSDLIEDDAKLEYEQLETNLQVHGAELDALDRFVDGFEQFMDGAVVVFEAFEYFDTEAYSSAEPKFRTAEDNFEQSEETLALLEADPDTPRQFESDIIEFHCYAESFYEASGHYAESAAAATEGDWNRAEQYAIEGDAALDQCA